MYRLRYSAAVAVAALALGGDASVAAAPVAATPRVADGASPATGAAPAVSAARFAKLPAHEVAARLSRSTGVLVLADKTVATAPVTLDVPAGPLDAALARVAAVLPKGTVVKKALLPAPSPGGPAPDGDQVAALVAAQEALAASGGRKDPATAPGEEINVLGKRLSGDKAATVITALDLRPVYLLTNPAAADDPVQKMNAAQLDSMRLWLGMTPEQQTAVVDQQFNALMNMDPAMRQQLFSQQRQVMQGFFQRIQGLPEEQRTQFFREMTGGRWDGTGMPPRRDNPEGTGGDPRQP